MPSSPAPGRRCAAFSKGRRTPTLVGGPGRISDRRVDLWAADLLPTISRPAGSGENVTEMNCAVAHVTLSQGLAQVEIFC